MTLKNFGAGMLSVLLFAITARADLPIVYVDIDAPAGGNGSSWETAFAALQDALDAVRHQEQQYELRVANGTYLPDVGATVESGDRWATFNIPFGVRLYGGYAGFGADDPDARNRDEWPTVFSGDLAGDDTPEFGHVNQTDNSVHVVTVFEATFGTRLDGVTIYGGHSTNDEAHEFGAGIWLRDGTLILESCDIDFNASQANAGVHVENATLIASNCLFTRNRTAVGGEGVFRLFGCEFRDNQGSRAGGLVTEESEVRIENCTFESNSPFNNSSGGAVACRRGTVEIRDSIFRNNRNESNSGAGALYVSAAPCLITNCLFEFNGSEGWGLAGGFFHSGGTLRVNGTSFINNQGRKGGGFYSGSADEPDTVFQFTNCRFEGNYASESGGGLTLQHHTRLFGCSISGNEAADGGSAIHLRWDEAELIGCTVVANRGTTSPGILVSTNTELMVANSILRNGTTFDQEIRVEGDGVFELRYSSITSWEYAIGGVGMTRAEPMLIDMFGPDGIGGTGDENLRLFPGSPCIDTGSNNDLSLCALDLDGRERRVNDPQVPDGGEGSGAIVDMGAFERLATSVSPDCDRDLLDDDCAMDGAMAEALAPDCDDNGVVDSCEVHLPGVDCNASGVPDVCELLEADCNGNGIVDSCDILSADSNDCNGNDRPDECDVIDGTSSDVDGNGAPDECQRDCNLNGVPDVWDIELGESSDENENGVPDECDGVLNPRNGIHYLTINMAIEDAQEGDVIEIGPGTYPEFVIIGAQTIHLRSISGPDVTFIDGEGERPLMDLQDNAHVIIEGIGFVNGHRGNQTAPVNVDAQSASFIDCVFRGNNGEDLVGAMYVRNYDAHLLRCLFEDNTGELAGAIWTAGNSEPLMQDCTFRNNSNGAVRCNHGTFERCRFETNSGKAAIYGAFLRATDCTFLENTDSQGSGAIYVTHMSSSSASATVERSVFIGNSGRDGGSISTNVIDRLSVTNCLFVDSYASRDGGVVSAGGSDITLFSHCTFWGCDAGDDGDIVDGRADLLNSVMWNIGDKDGPDSDFLGNGSAFHCVAEMAPFSGQRLNSVFVVDPMFVDPESGNFRLQPDSPLIDLAPYMGETIIGAIDLDGGKRVIGCSVDIGAFESPHAGGDCDRNGVVDACEISASPWLDCDQNGRLDICDLIADPALDCDGDGQLDSCQTAYPQITHIPPLALSGSSFDFIVPVESTNWAATILFGGMHRYAMWLNDGEEQIRPDNPSSCNDAITERDIAPEIFNRWIDDGLLSIRFSPTAGPCPRDFVAGRIEVKQDWRLIDCNNNDLPDSCDIDSGFSADLNGNGMPDECEPDCDENGVPDFIDIMNGASDCDNNGVLDSCEVGDHDCNVNGVHDACDILSGYAQDCNFNGTPDYCDINFGSSEDVDEDGVPDECDNDCNGNGISDPEEIATGLASDCNHNNVPDSCDIDLQYETDCNNNGQPDSCEVGGIRVLDSGSLAPFYWLRAQSFQYPAENARPEDPVTFTATAKSDLNGSTEEVIVLLQGEIVGVFFGGSEGNSCTNVPSVESLELSAADYNEIVGSAETVEWILSPSYDVRGSSNCDENVTMVVTYRTDTPADANGDGILDLCDCTADLDGSGDVNMYDMLDLLGSWGPCEACPSDLNQDGVVGTTDLLTLLVMWGPCP